VDGLAGGGRRGFHHGFAERWMRVDGGVDRVDGRVERHGEAVFGNELGRLGAVVTRSTSRGIGSRHLFQAAQPVRKIPGNSEDNFPTPLFLSQHSASLQVQ